LLIKKLIIDFKKYSKSIFSMCEKILNYYKILKKKSNHKCNIPNIEELEIN